MTAGNLLKLKSTLNTNHTVEYALPLGEELIPLNPLVGKKIKLEFTGQINCIATGKKIKKSYAQGYSYESYMTLARCDFCIVRPELCHFKKGTCREPSWGEDNCMQPHVVYLANSSGLKVGITRRSQVPTRWIDQGASFAIELFEVKDRLTSGLIEVELAKGINDKTNWRKMLAGEVPEVDLISEKKKLIEKNQDLIKKHEAIIMPDEIREISYPVLSVPEKISSLSFDKTPIIEQKLLGIKGQYLIFESGVINMRKHQGYFLSLEF